jgi:two-component system, NarL family, response regulator NreC
MRRLRAVLADDHGIVRRGLRALLEADESMEVVGEASTGREAVDLCESLTPDLAIFDIAMPQLNGIEAAELAIKRTPSLKVIMLSMYAHESYLIRSLVAGARGYLLKDAADEDLVPAVKAVAQGRSYFSPGISQMLASEYVRQIQDSGEQDSYSLLTTREKEILQLLAEGRSNKEAATVLSIGVSTVETHRANLMQKLNLHNTAELVLYAVRKGIVR